MARSTVRPINKDELGSEIKQRDAFDKAIEDRFDSKDKEGAGTNGNNITSIEEIDEMEDPVVKEMGDSDKEDSDNDEDVDIVDADINLRNAEVYIPKDDNAKIA